MRLTQKDIERIISEILAQKSRGVPCSEAAFSPAPDAGQDEILVPVGVSNRHVHLSRADMDSLFGPGAQLGRKKAMKQPGQFAAAETVTLKGPKGALKGVRVLGPLRPETQVEILAADGFVLGVKPPLRMSGQLDGTPGLEIVGPKGSVRIEAGVIMAVRHIHMLPEMAARLGLANGQEVDVEVAGPRGGVLGRVVVRAAQASAFEMHIDVEEANAFGLGNDDLVRIRKG